MYPLTKQEHAPLVVHTAVPSLIDYTTSMAQIARSLLSKSQVDF